MTTDTRAKEAVVARGGFTVGGMAKGSGMIHPDLATMLAVVTTDYPLEPGEAIELPAAGGRDELQRDLGRRRAVHERLRDPARERRERRATRDDDAFAAALERGVRRPRAPGRRRRRGHHRARRDHRHRRRRRRAGEGDRAPDRDLAARQDRALRPRRELGPRADGRRLGAVERRLRGRSTPARITLALQRHDRPRRAARRPTSSPTSRARAARSSSTSASATGSASYLTSDLSYDYVQINADYRT